MRHNVYMGQGSDNHASIAEIVKLMVCDVDTQDMAVISSIDALDTPHGLTAGPDVYIYIYI